MNQKEMIEQLKANMPEFSGTDEEKEIQKSLYIYIELGKTKSFDEKYYYGNSETQKKIYTLAQRQEKDLNKLTEKRKIICVSLTYLYCDLLKKFGINAISSVPDDTGHVYPIIITKNGNKFIADLQLDLENIQTKSRLEHFDYIRDTQKNQEAITDMLIKIGYIKDEQDYKDKEIEKLRKQIKGMNPHRALDTILQDEQLYSENEYMEGVEVSKFYIKILKKIMPHFLNKKVYAFNCYRKNENDEKDYTLCVFSEEDDIRTYLFSKKDKRFLNVDTNKMLKLEKEGLVLGAKTKESGSNKLKKYIEKNAREEESR